VGEHLERAVVISSFVSGGASLSGRSLGGGRTAPSKGRSGLTGLRSSGGGSQPLGGRGSGEGLGHRRTSWLSTGSRGWRLAGKCNDPTNR